jgi:hypothetical protein
MVAEVITLRSAPLVNDIPGQMRQMASMIERGEIEAQSVIFIIPRDGDWPETYGWGERMADLDKIAVCELVKAFFTAKYVEK